MTRFFEIFPARNSQSKFFQYEHIFLDNCLCLFILCNIPCNVHFLRTHILYWKGYNSTSTYLGMFYDHPSWSTGSTSSIHYESLHIKNLISNKLLQTTNIIWNLFLQVLFERKRETYFRSCWWKNIYILNSGSVDQIQQTCEHIL